MKLHWSDKRKKYWFIHLYRTPFALPGSIFGYGREEEGLTWDKWEKKIKKICPIQLWFRQDFVWFWDGQFHRISRKWYELKCWFKPYNVLKLKHLPNTWIDEKELLIHANFAVLERFMGGKPGEIINWDSDDEHKHAWKEINEIWDWWQKRDERIELEQQITNNWYENRNNKEFEDKLLMLSLDTEKMHEKQTEEMLIRLIKVRSFLWI